MSENRHYRGTDLVLPHIARDLCRKGLDLVVDLKAQLPAGIVEERLKEVVDLFIDQYNRLEGTNIQEHAAALDFLALPKLNDELLGNLEDLGFSDDSASPFVQFLAESPEQNLKLLHAALIVYLVSMLGSFERTAVEQNLDYAQTMKALNYSVSLLHEVILAAKSLPTLIEIYAARDARAAGGKSGGKAANPHYQKLKQKVLEDARAIQGKVTPLEAARSIYASLGPNYLNNPATKQEFFADSVRCFYGWIKTDWEIGS